LDASICCLGEQREEDQAVEQAFWPPLDRPQLERTSAFSVSAPWAWRQLRLVEMTMNQNALGRRRGTQQQ